MPRYRWYDAFLSCIMLSLLWYDALPPCTTNLASWFSAFLLCALHLCILYFHHETYTMYLTIEQFQSVQHILVYCTPTIHLSTVHFQYAPFALEWCSSFSILHAPWTMVWFSSIMHYAQLTLVRCTSTMHYGSCNLFTVHLCSFYFCHAICTMLLGIVKFHCVQCTLV